MKGVVQTVLIIAAVVEAGRGILGGFTSKHLVLDVNQCDSN